MSRVVGDVLNFFSSRRRHTRCALVTGVRRVLFLSLLRSTTTEHPSGLHVVAAPPDIIPLESVSAEQMSDILDLARQEFSNRSEEHTSELQSLMRISYAVFCLKKKKKNKNRTPSQK